MHVLACALPLHLALDLLLPLHVSLVPIRERHPAKLNVVCALFALDRAAPGPPEVERELLAALERLVRRVVPRPEVKERVGEAVVASQGGLEGVARRRRGEGGCEVERVGRVGAGGEEEEVEVLGDAGLEAPAVRVEDPCKSVSRSVVPRPLRREEREWGREHTGSLCPPGVVVAHELDDEGLSAEGRLELVPRNAVDELQGEGRRRVARVEAVLEAVEPDGEGGRVGAGRDRGEPVLEAQ